jgi:hypothetical protein
MDCTIHVYKTKALYSMDHDNGSQVIAVAGNDKE